MEYPQYTNNQAKVIVTTENGNKKRAMFYWNGGKPTFASYGMDITDNVIDWEYDTELEEKILKFIENDEEHFFAPEWFSLIDNGKHSYKAVLTACYSLVEKGILKKRDCSALAFERI